MKYYQVIFFYAENTHGAEHFENSKSFFELPENDQKWLEMVNFGHFLHFLSNFSQWKLNTEQNILLKFDVFSLLSKQVLRARKLQNITKTVILDIFCYFYYFFRNEDKYSWFEEESELPPSLCPSTNSGLQGPPFNLSILRMIRWNIVIVRWLRDTFEFD